MEVSSPEQLIASANRYEKVADILRTAAQHQFAVEVPEDVYQIWKSTLIAARYTDIVIDEQDEQFATDRTWLFDCGLQYLADPKTEVVSNSRDFTDVLTSLKTSLNCLDDLKKLSFISTLGQLLTLTRRIPEIQNVHDLASATRLEGQLTARLLAIPLIALSKRGGQERQFVRWMTRVGRFGNLIDTAIDLPGDYQTHTAAVKPTLKNRSILAWHGRHDVSEVVRHISGRVMRDMGGAALGTFLGRRAIYKWSGNSEA